MPLAVVIQALGPPTMAKLYQWLRDVPMILHALKPISGSLSLKLTVFLREIDRATFAVYKKNLTD
jgi:hypothetical protein